MSNEFAKTMAGLHDEKLIEILQTRSEYLPEAVEAAEAEVKKRNIPADLFSEKTVQVQERIERQQTKRSENAEKPLEGILKFFLVAAPVSMIVIHMFLMGKYRAEGYDRKKKETIEYFKIGLLVFLGIILLIQFINWLP